MPTAKVTYHSFSAAPRYNGTGDVIGVLPSQIGARASISFTSTPGYGAAQTSNVIARVLSDTDCGIANIGPAATVTLNDTMPIKAGVPQEILITNGNRLGVIAES